MVRPPRYKAEEATHGTAVRRLDKGVVLLNPPDEGPPVQPLGPVKHLVGDIGEPAFGYALGAMQESPIPVALAPLLVCQTIAEPTPEPRHTLASPVVHRARQVDLANTPPARRTQEPRAPSAKPARGERQRDLLNVLAPVAGESNHRALLAYLPFKRILRITVCPHLCELKVTPRAQRMARLNRQARPPVPYTASTHFIVSLFPCMS